MRIKIAILEEDVVYLGRVSAVFGTKYADKLEVYSFTDYDVAMANLERSRIDILLASDIFEVDTSMLPARCGFAYLVDASDVEAVRDQRAVCKFQKADLIYRQILSIYAEQSEHISGGAAGEKGKIICFSSPCGGTGTSTLAAACAMNIAGRGLRVIYLNLETFGAADVFFHAEGSMGMSDIVYALESRKNNFSLKLESCVKQDEAGVYFFSAPNIPLDMMELETSDILTLLNEISLIGEYDYIILDIPFSLDKKKLEIYSQAQSFVVVSDGSETANGKVERAAQAIEVLEQTYDMALNNRIVIMYNRFDGMTGRKLENLPWTVLGGSPKYEYAACRPILEQLAQMDMFARLLSL